MSVVACGYPPPELVVYSFGEPIARVRIVGRISNPAGFRPAEDAGDSICRHDEGRKQDLAIGVLQPWIQGCTMLTSDRPSGPERESRCPPKHPPLARSSW